MHRHLGAMDVTLLGIGAIIGAGIFVLTGNAAAANAGPGIVLSFIIAGTVAAFAALSYAEMASTVPVSGSAYTYTYATMGEFVAWIIGWDLILGKNKKKKKKTFTIFNFHFHFISFSHNYIF